MNTINNEIAKLLPLYFEGCLNDTQTQKIESWLAESSDNREIADNIADIYRKSDTLFAMNNVDTNSAFKIVNSKIIHSRMRKILIKIERVAAVLFIPLLFLTILQFYNSLHKNPVSMMALATSSGMTASVILPDGTAVKLNSDSKLTYPSAFTGDIREISLQGEAFFNVTKDANHPFIVRTPQKASIKVFGTHFNVEAYPKDDIVTATLEKGSIAMLYRDRSHHSIEKFIEPGEAIVYSRKYKNTQINKVDVDVATSWKDGRLIFRNTPVKEVLRSLSKRFGVDFVVCNKKVYSNSFTGTLERQRLDRILEYMTLTSGMHFKYLPNNDMNKLKQIIEVN